MHPVVVDVTRRIVERSRATREPYLQRLARLALRTRGAQRLGCANVAHAFAALPPDERLRVVAERAPHLAIVSAYNDMLSAHQPYEHYPAWLRDEAHRAGATVQVAGGVPAMCDGITQGQPGMDLSLFSRDVIAQATAIALSHDVFDGALLLGVCDKIVPGLLIGALHFGHLPCAFVPAGPMGSGLPNKDKAKVREQFAQGLVGREALLEAEMQAYHSPGTCTFYGTANSNQMLLEAMGLHVPGSAFVPPHGPLREALSREAVRQLLPHARQPGSHAAIGRLVDERCIVNAMVALLATGGSTNHLIHWVAVARAAGIVIDWSDFSALSAVVPLLARVYPNGDADVNDLQAAGGPGFVLRELIDAGLMHADVATLAGADGDDQGLRAHARLPVLDGERLTWREPPSAQNAKKDAAVLRGVAAPFASTGGLRVLSGNLGRAVIKVSAVPEDRWVIEAPARVFDSQAALQAAFKAGELACDVVVVVRFQGPAACGMPELHQLTPPLSVLQSQGHRVALVTDGRMSGASGKVPAAIHVCPEALHGGALARVQDGDVLRVDAQAGTLDVLVDLPTLAARPLAQRSAAAEHDHTHDLGRELFAGMRRNVGNAEEGACTWL